MELRLKKEITTIPINDKDVELVQTLANDATVAIAAQILKIKVRTAEGRIFRLRSKTGVKTLQGLVWLFYKNGLIK